MPISVDCGKCRKTIKAPDKYAGRSAKCPACGSAVTIPAASDGFDDLISKELEPERDFIKEISCPYCSEKIKATAQKCKHCGELIGQARRDAETVSRYEQPKISNEWNPGVAAALSLLIPGAGQMYRGKVGIGFAWLICVSIGYVAFIIPGLVLHVLCVLTAAAK